MVRSNLHCTECGQLVVYELDLSINGNHEIVCKNCGHTHYRVVRNGVITEDRYNSSQPTWTATIYTATTNDYVMTSNPSSSWGASIWYQYSDSSTTGG